MALSKFEGPGYRGSVVIPETPEKMLNPIQRKKGDKK
jgi:hypothetical protein